MLELEYERLVKTSEGFKGIPKGMEMLPAKEGSLVCDASNAVEIDQEHPEIRFLNDRQSLQPEEYPEGTVFEFFNGEWIPESEVPPVEKRDVYKADSETFIEDNGSPRLVEEDERLYAVLKMELADLEPERAYSWDGEKWNLQKPCRMLEDARKSKIAELNAKWKEAEQSPFVCSFGKPVDAGDRAILDIESLLRLSGEKVNFCFADNSFIELSRQELESLLEEILVRRQSIHGRKFSLRDAIETESDPLALHLMEISF